MQMQLDALDVSRPGRRRPSFGIAVRKHDRSRIQYVRHRPDITLTERPTIAISTQAKAENTSGGRLPLASASVERFALRAPGDGDAMHGH
jgi:hypothetical protein